MANEIVELYLQGVKRQDIAYRIGVSKPTVNRYILRELGSQKTDTTEHSEQDIQDWKEFRSLGFPYAEIAEAYKATESTVHYHVNKVRENKSAGRPSIHNPEVVAEWLKVKAEGATYQKIADKHDVNPNTVKYQVTKAKEVNADE